MFEFIYFLVVSLPFSVGETDHYPVKLIQHFLYESNIACGNILETRNLSSDEKVEIFSYFKILTKEFSLFTALKFENRLKNTRRCPTTLNVVFGWHQGMQERLIEISYKEKLSGSVWLIFLPLNMTAQEYLNRINIPFNAEYFITARMEAEEIVLERSYKVDFNYPLRVSKYGVWHKNLNAMLDDSYDYVYSGRKNLEDFPVRVSTKDDFPVSKLIRIGKKKHKIGGYFGLVLDELAERLKFKPVYVKAQQNSTGSPNENGTWNGLLGMLQRDEIDLAIGPQVFDRRVTSVASFLKPLIRSNFQIFFKHDGNLVDFLIIFKPFDIYIWLSIVLWVLVSSITMDCLYTYEVQMNHEKRKRHEEFTKLNSLFKNLAALCHQGTTTPESYSCRNMFFMTLILSVVLVTAYSAVLISNLANREPSRPFNSLETFLEDGSYKLVAIGDSTDYSYFSNASDYVRKEIFSRAMKPAPESKFIFTKEQGMDVICRKKRYALFIVFEVPKITAQQYSNDEKLDCEILHLKIPLDVVFLSIPRRKDLPYAEIFDWELLKMETAGILKRLRNQVWPLEQINKNNNYTPVNIEHVLLIYGILILGMILSIFIFAIELRFDKRRQKKLLRDKEMFSLGFSTQ